MKKLVLFLTFIAGSSLIHAAAPMTPAQAEQKLIITAGSGDVQEVQRLLQVPRIDVNALSHAGFTALMEAAWNGHEEIVELLLKDPRIDVNAADDWDNTALMEAAFYGFEEIAKMLLQAGADKDLKDSDGNTAEQLARENGNAALANFIRDYQPGQLTKSARKR